MFWMASARRRLAGTHRHRRGTAFERRHPDFQRIGRRIHDAAVDVAEFLQREEIGGMLAVAELVGRRLIDRHRDGAVGRVHAGAGMNRHRFGLGVSWS